jgi:sugar lactone lactonase YvrE
VTGFSKPLCALLTIAALSLAADDITDSRKLQQAGLTAYKNKDAGAFLRNIQAASALRPQHPTLLVQLAVAQASNGQHEAALRTLERVAAMGFVFVPDDAELEPVRALPAFAALARRLEANASAIGAPRKELAVDRIGLIPEGLAYDAAGDRFFVGSVRTRTIFVVSKRAAAKPFATAPWGVFGMAVDAKRGVLWATTTALPQMEGFVKEEEGKAALLKIDLRGGAVLATIPAPAGGPHHFGDVAVTADGEVFVSDSRAPVIYRVAGNAVEPFVTGGFSNLQGIAPAGRILYVSDYSRGLMAVDRVTRDVHWLRVPETASLLGVDGLYRASDGSLLATQNGTDPNRIIRIRLAPGGLAVSSVETLASHAPGMADPTLGVVARNRFWFNANGQWDLFGDDGKIADPLRLSEALVLSVPVD